MTCIPFFLDRCVQIKYALFRRNLTEIRGTPVYSYERKIYLLLLLALIGIIIAGLATDGISDSIRGFLHLQTMAARLINDFTLVGGIGGALLNAGLMGLLSLLLIKLSGVTLSGPTVAATLTIVGFSLFGKTPLNTVPIEIGRAHV